MTLLNLVQPVSRGQSQYLLQALSAQSISAPGIVCTFFIPFLNRHFTRYTELYRRWRKNFLSSDPFTHKCDGMYSSFLYNSSNCSSPQSVRLHNCANLFSLSGSSNQCFYSLFILHGLLYREYERSNNHLNKRTPKRV